MILIILHILFFIYPSVLLFRSIGRTLTCKPSSDLLYYSRNRNHFAFTIIFTCAYKIMYFQRGISLLYVI